MAKREKAWNIALRAISIPHAQSQISPPENEELDRFIAVVREIDSRAAVCQALPEVQLLLQVLQRHGIAQVFTDVHGVLCCDAYDAATGTLSIPEIIFNSACLINEELDSFVVVRHLIGSLQLIDQPQLTRLHGLNSMAAIEGDLVIEHTGVQDLVEICSRLERIKGNLRICHNENLRSISGFNNLVSIDKSLEIIGNSLLEILKAFECLRQIKKGALTVRHSPLLKEIKSFSELKSVKLICINNLSIQDVDFLLSLFKFSPNFPGAIRITHCCINQLRGLTFLRTVASSLYLDNNFLESLEGLNNLSFVGASFSAANNCLRNLVALQKLKKVNGVLVLSGNRLTTLDGLQNLLHLKTKKWSDKPLTLSIARNPYLKNLESLKNVRVLGVLISDVNFYKGDYILPVGSSDFYRNDFSFIGEAVHEQREAIICPKMGPA